MNWLKFYKTKKVLKSFREIKTDKVWLESMRRELEVLTGTKAPRATFVLMPRLAPVLAAVLIFAMVGGGTVFASQEALPSDVLYPVKLLSERFQSFFVFGTESKVNFALKLAEKRIDEAEVEAEVSFSDEAETSLVSEGAGDEELINVQAFKEGEVIVGTVFRAQEHLASVQASIGQLKDKDKDLDKMEKIFERLENLEQRQQKIAERLRVRIPQLARLIEAVQVGTVDVKNELDKVIITISLNNTTSSTTSDDINGDEDNDFDRDDVARRRVQSIIDRAEKKIALVEEKLDRFGGAVQTINLGEWEDYFGDAFDNFDGDLPPGLSKKANKLSNKFEKQFNKLFDKFEKKFGKLNGCSFEEAQELIREAKELLQEAKEELSDGDWTEAAKKALEAFNKAVKAESKINFGVICRPPSEPEEPEEPEDTTAPTITSGPIAFEVSTSSAKIGWRTNELSNSIVEYGTTTSYGLSASSSALATSHVISLVGLNASTTYHYRIKSADAAGNTSTSSDKTFTTVALVDITPPTISDVNATSVGTSSAVINWITNELADSEVEYGLDTTYGSSSSSSALVTSHSVGVSGLNTDTQYHFRVKSRDEAGNLSVSGDNTFTTATTSP
jgi:Tfp pilus assembly protein PilN